MWRNAPDGPYVEYYDCGSLACTGTVKSGERVGEWLIFDETGRIVSRRLYADGRHFELSLVMQAEA